MKSPFLVAIFTYNNGKALEQLLARFPEGYPYDVVVHVDGSTDGSDAVLSQYPHAVLRQDHNSGIGRSMRNVFAFARDKGYQAVALMPGNNKNDPLEVERLIRPIEEGRADFVQGSRYTQGGRRDHTPLFRLVMVKVHAWFVSVLVRRKVTDALEGFRAFRLSLLDDPDIDIEQDWLNTYGLETYLFYKVAVNRKYGYVEVPVSKIYPVNKRGLLNRKGMHYSHIRPFIDWWQILKPLFVLSLGIRK